MNYSKNTSEKHTVSLPKRFALGAASVVAATALVGIGAQGAFAASPDGGTSGSGSATATTTATASPQGAHASGSTDWSLSGHLDGAKAQDLAKKLTADPALFSLLPATLQSDLTALSNATVADRTADAQKIVSTALSGGYGSTVQGIATKLTSDHDHDHLGSLPRSVQHDLTSLTKAPQDEQGPDLQKLATKALGGGYGSSVQKLAEQIQSGILSGN
ncbi:MAG: hypothetical protein ABI130_03170 [Leifsonia sp.]